MKRFYFYFNFLVFVFLFVFAALANAAANTAVFLNDSSCVAGDLIRLGQIAKISGEHKSVLDTLTVSNAAPAGLSRFLLKTNVAAAIPAQIRANVTINGSDRIKIYSQAQKISFEELAKKATVLLQDSLANNENVKSEIFFEFAEGRYANVALGEYEVILGKIDRQRLRGRVIIPLIIVQENGAKRTRVSINAAVRVVAKVCVATRSIARNESFGPGDLEMKHIDISTLQGTPLFEMPKINEFNVIGVIREGTVVTNRHVVPKPAVEVGSDVRMTSDASSVKVSVIGRARSAGGIGDVILVENVNSKKIVRGKIIQPGVVEIVRGGTI